MSKSYPTPNGLSQLDPGGVLKNSHEIQAEAFRVIDIDNLVEHYFTRVDVTYNVQGSAISAIFYYDKNNHIESIQVTDDVAGSLNNQYFTIDGVGGKNKYYIWYNVDGIGVDPAIAGRQGIEVPISANDTANIVALATRLAAMMNSNLASEFTVQSIDSKVKFTGKIPGAVTFDLSNIPTFTSEVVSLGVTELIKSIELPFENGVRYVYNEYEKTFEIFPALSSLTDTISIGDEDGDQLQINPDGSINVVISDVAGSVLTTQYFEVDGIAQGVTTSLASFVAVPNRKLQKIELSGTNIAEYELVINGSTVDKKRTYFGNSLNSLFDFNEGLPLISGQTVEIFVVHDRPFIGDFNCRVQLLEI